MNLALGSTVRCSDGPVRELADVVVDAGGRRVTHIVVQPKHQHESARLVALELVSEDAEGLALHCTADMLDKLEPVREYAYLPAGAKPEEGGEWDVGVEDVLVVPSFEPTDVAEPELDPNVNLMYDRVPKGEVEVRRASVVISADGHSLGEVDGFVVDTDEHITHFVLERGHLWGRKEVTIPIGAVDRIESDEVYVALTKDEVGALPAVRVGRHG